MTDLPTMVDLAPAGRQLATVVAGITDDQLTAPTPCEDTTVAGLLDHVIGLTQAFTDAAHKVGGDSVPQASADALDPDWRTTIPRQIDALVVAWQGPAAWEGDTKAGGVVAPAAIMGQVAMNEMLIHGWDLARATGQSYDTDDASAEVSLGLLSASADDDSGEGMFGPVVTVPDDAPPLDRALGLSGRDPSWSPPS